MAERNKLYTRKILSRIIVESMIGKTLRVTYFTSAIIDSIVVLVMINWTFFSFCIFIRYPFIIYFRFHRKYSHLIEQYYAYIFNFHIKNNISQETLFVYCPGVLSYLATPLIRCTCTFSHFQSIKRTQNEKKTLCGSRTFFIDRDSCLINHNIRFITFEFIIYRTYNIII
jgi:hypothetical protein